MLVDGFYIKTNAPKFKQTAIPTGMLRSPLDLVTKPQPWLTVSNNPDENMLEKKTLIFADHLYQYRPVAQRYQIVKELTEVLNAGFTILILEPTGTLQPWDGLNISNSYSLSFEKYTDGSATLHTSYILLLFRR